jgi:hypothetical protein
MPANDLIVQAAVSTSAPGLVTRGGWLLAFLEQKKSAAVLQRESADAIFLLDEIATHRSVIEECLPRAMKAL